jgi:hypothetical protein
MNLQEQYKRLFKSRSSSNDSKLLSEAKGFEDIVDVQKFIRVNDLKNRGDYNKFENEEELVVPFKQSINGENEFYADVDVFDGGTSFRLDKDLVDALNNMGVDEDDFREEMEMLAFSF